MFNLSSGSITKYYDGSTDRLMVETNGNITMSSISLSISTLMTINSANYELPINSNITVTVRSGGKVSIGQDIALLPGSKIVIDEGAELSVDNGCNLYVYDADQWGTYAGAGNKKFIPVRYAPGQTYNRTEADLTDAGILVNGTLDANSGTIYTTSDGANIHSTANGTAIIKQGSQTTTYQLIQGAAEPYVSIPITTAKLKNADGSYASGTGTFNYGGGFWCNHEKKDAAAVSATCTSTGLTEGKVCSKGLCGYTTQVVIPTLPHSEKTVSGTPPTCTDAGTSDKIICSVCTHVISDHAELGALGHDIKTAPGREPTYTEAGWKPYEYCARCDYTEQIEYIPVLGESSAEGMDYVFSYVEYTASGIVILLENTTENDFEGIAVLAAYNADGKLLKVLYSDAVISAEAKVSFTVTVVEGANVAKVKGYVLGSGYAPQQSAWEKVFYENVIYS